MEVESLSLCETIPINKKCKWRVQSKTYLQAILKCNIN